MQEYHKRVQEKLDLIYGNNILNKAEVEECYISKDKMREKLQKLRKEYNKLVNKTNEQEIIEHLIDFNKCTAKIEIIRELLEE